VLARDVSKVLLKQHKAVPEDAASRRRQTSLQCFSVTSLKSGDDTVDTGASHTHTHTHTHTDASTLEYMSSLKRWSQKISLHLVVCAARHVLPFFFFYTCLITEDQSVSDLMLPWQRLKQVN